jgi:hypothetical protein
MALIFIKISDLDHPESPAEHHRICYPAQLFMGCAQTFLRVEATRYMQRRGAPVREALV